MSAPSLRVDLICLADWSNRCRPKHMSFWTAGSQSGIELGSPSYCQKSAFITAITAMPIIMAVFIIGIIAVSLAGLIIEPVLSGITIVATAVGGIEKEAPGSRLWCFLLCPK